MNIQNKTGTRTPAMKGLWHLCQDTDGVKLIFLGADSKRLFTKLV